VAAFGEQRIAAPSEHALMERDCNADGSVFWEVAGHGMVGPRPTEVSMEHFWSGVAAIAMLSAAATASAQAPLSPSGAVNKTQPPSIAFPSAPPAPPAGAATKPAAEAAIPAPSPASTEAAGKPPAPTPGAALPEQGTTGSAAATPPSEGERSTAVARPKRPVRNAEGEASGETRSATSRAQRYPGDDVADALNARELSRLDGGPGPGPVARPMGPSTGYYPRPPAYGPPPGYGPVYAPPPGYPPYPPPPMMRPY
jgi:hypothetical protein